MNESPMWTLGKVLWILSGCVAGMAVAFALVVAVELISSVVHPVPEGFGGTKEEICVHVAHYPRWVLALVVPAWGFTAFASAWTAKRIGGLEAVLFVGLLLTACVVLNVTMLPYPLWFKILSVAIVVVAIGNRLRQRRVVQ